MGIHSRQHDHARHRHGPRGRPDRGKAPSRLCTRAARGLILFLCALAAPVAAEPLRIATWHVELSRRGPGLLLRDILRDDPQVEAVATILADVAPDILLLTDIDHDMGLAALGALRDRVGQSGPSYPHLFAPQQNSGRDSGLDLDGDGRLAGPDDALGYGGFTGQGGIALLSRHPVETEAFRDFTDLRWRDLPGNLMEGAEVPQEAQAAMRLSSTAHWVVPLRIGKRRLTLLAFSATPPVFDGPEDRNGRRNHDEVIFWQTLLDGAFGPPPEAPLVLLGNANLDPQDGQGRYAAIRALLADPRLQDPRPADPRAAEDTNPGQAGDPALDTANWDDPDPGNLRVDYVLPSAGLEVIASGTLWPAPGSLAARASRHALVWVDLDWPPE